MSFKSGKPKPYHARVQRRGKDVTLGFFETAEEAALAYARTPEAHAAVAAAAASPAPPPMTTEEALRLAEAEGLTLVRSESSRTGYKGVSFKSGKPKPYHAEVRRGGKPVTLGYFATAEEAALIYARALEEERAAAAAAVAPPPMPGAAVAEGAPTGEVEAGGGSPSQTEDPHMHGPPMSEGRTKRQRPTPVAHGGGGKRKAK